MKKLLLILLSYCFFACITDWDYTSDFTLSNESKYDLIIQSNHNNARFPNELILLSSHSYSWWLSEMYYISSPVQTGGTVYLFTDTILLKKTKYPDFFNIDYYEMEQTGKRARQYTFRFTDEYIESLLNEIAE